MGAECPYIQFRILEVAHRSRHMCARTIMLGCKEDGVRKMFSAIAADVRIEGSENRQRNLLLMPSWTSGTDPIHSHAAC